MVHKDLYPSMYETSMPYYQFMEFVDEWVDFKKKEYEAKKRHHDEQQAKVRRQAEEARRAKRKRK